MPLVSCRVDVTDDFGRVTSAVNDLARRAVEAAAREGAAAASAVASQRSKSGRMAAIRPDNAIGTPDGWRASFVSPVHYAWYQNYGTLGSRRKKLKASTLARRSTPSGQARLARVQGSAGIEPLRFLEAGRRAGRKALLETITRGL